MKTTILSFIILALMLVGCVGEAWMINIDYYFVNATDKTIEFEAYDVDEYYPSDFSYSFSIPPGRHAVISGKYFPENGPFFPFNYCNYIRLSNGEKTVIKIDNHIHSGDNIRDPLFRWQCYEEIWCSKRKTSCYRYIFTDADFRDGTPITEE